MKIVAPLILTLGLSFLLYSTKEVWPKSDYDGRVGAAVSQTRQRGARGVRGPEYSMPGYTEEALDLDRSRQAGFGGAQPFQYGRSGAGRDSGNPIDLSSPAQASGQAR